MNNLSIAKGSDMSDLEEVVYDGEIVEPRVEEIVKLQAEEVQLVGDLENNRWRQAELIAAELDGGRTQRQLADEIGKGKSHVNRMAQVWREFGVPHGGQERSFDSYYQEKKRGSKQPKIDPPTTDQPTEDTPRTDDQWERDDRDYSAEYDDWINDREHDQLDESEVVDLDVVAMTQLDLESIVRKLSLLSEWVTNQPDKWDAEAAASAVNSLDEISASIDFLRKVLQ